MPSVFPPIEAASIRELATQLGLPRRAHSRRRSRPSTAPCSPATFDHTALDDCRTAGLQPEKTHWAQRIDTPPFWGYPLRPGITFTYLGVRVDERARVLAADGTPFDNVYAAGEIMAGNVLRKGYIAGIGMTIGTVFGRIAGRVQHAMQLDELTREGARMAVCNACRYCEQYCPAFQAMEQRLSFASADLNYLANLCHNCGECLYACQYAPPHEFAINVPQTLARVRVRSYEQYAWPAAVAGAFRQHNMATALLLSLRA